MGNSIVFARLDLVVAVYTAGITLRQAITGY
jgi:hypothetical protein